MINLFFKGFIIGLGKVMPGVSGSVLAISFGIYDKIIDIVGNFPKKIKNNIKFVIPIMLGFIVSLTLFSNLLSILINKYYVIMMFLFLGLIIGGMPDLIKKFKFRMSTIIIFLISFAFVTLISFLNQINNINKIDSLSFIWIGLLEAFTSIVPGISGTAIMMIIGCYNSVLTMFSNIFLLSNLKYLILFLIGVSVGAILTSKLISYLLKKYYDKVFASIAGFMCSSILFLFLKIAPSINGITHIFIGLIFMFVGIKLSSILS